MIRLWNCEPAIVLGLAQSAIALAIAFGARLSAEQVGAMMAMITALGAVLVRSQVSPVGGAPK